MHDQIQKCRNGWDEVELLQTMLLSSRSPELHGDHKLVDSSEKDIIEEKMVKKKENHLSIKLTF